MSELHMIKILDHGYLKFIEDWGRGEANIPEAAIIEAARQSTQGSFRGWEGGKCQRCNGLGTLHWPLEDGGSPDMECPDCNGKGSFLGDEKLLGFLYNNHHATPFEFCGMTIEVQAPIAVFREWHRHRIQSFFETAFADVLDDTAYNEMSARYAPLPDINYIPTAERCLMISKANKQAGAVKGSDELTDASASTWLSGLDGFYKTAEALYQAGLKIGVPKELARLCLPVGRYSRMRATTNLRNWLAFLTLRMDPNAQWEIRQFANAVGDIIAERFPRTWKLFKIPGAESK